ncbi:hypothetical protein [Acaryochloris marina]|uniref:hypothetical protein n=1 Tax=Acaryochloris marina TaxID=155978 RepID=UPI0021C2AB8F|nr:hypothetical protein [Acaryochloris marina]BDM82251.1 hypothetical protein AM10699_51150 [Acaryochloris marina MBIC10699]
MMLKQTAATHRAPQKLQVFLLACLVVGINPLASLASEINPNPTEDAAIALETEPTELTETALTDDCLPTVSESEQPKVETTGAEVPVEEEGEVTEPCTTAEALTEEEFADADDGDIDLAEEETQGSSGPSINVNINIGSGGPLIGIGSSGNEGEFPPDDDFGEVPDPGLGEPVEEVLPVIPEKTPGPKILGSTPAVKPPAKAPKGLIHKKRLQKRKASSKKRVRLKPGARRLKRVKPSARRKLLRKQIKSNRRQIKSLGKRLRKNQRRIKSKRLRPTLRRSPARKRPLRRIKTVRPLLRRR